MYRDLFPKSRFLLVGLPPTVWEGQYLTWQGITGATLSPCLACVLLGGGGNRELQPWSEWMNERAAVRDRWHVGVEIVTWREKGMVAARLKIRSDQGRRGNGKGRVACGRDNENEQTVEWRRWLVERGRVRVTWFAIWISNLTISGKMTNRELTRGCNT